MCVCVMPTTISSLSQNLNGRQPLPAASHALRVDTCWTKDEYTRRPNPNTKDQGQVYSEEDSQYLNQSNLMINIS